MRLLKIVALKWKRRQILLEIEQLIVQIHHSPELIKRLNELELQLESLTQYLDGC